MPYVFKPKYTIPIPPAAERLTIKGKACVRWTSRRKVVVGEVCERNPERCRVESGKWWIVAVDQHGAVHKRPGFRDRKASERAASDLQTRLDRVAAGVLPASALADAAPLTELIEQWGRHLVNSGSGEEHRRTQLARVKRVVEGVDALRIESLQPGPVQAWLAAERKRAPRFGATTAGHHLGAVKAFTRWCVLVKKAAAADPLAGLSRTTDATDPRRRRRALSPAEFLRLLDVAAASTADVLGLTPFERRVLYHAAGRTGLRAAELASLTAASLDLDATPPVVRIEARSAKNRQADELPLSAPLVADLRRLLAGRAPGERLWPDRTGLRYPWHRRAAEVLAVDLAAAGIPVVLEGRVFDFHALRSQFATDLERAGVPLARAQRLLRHSTPDLTARHYTRPERVELAAELQKLDRPAAAPDAL